MPVRLPARTVDSRMDHEQYKALLDDVRTEIAALLQRKQDIERELEGTRQVESYLAHKVGIHPAEGNDAAPEAMTPSISPPIPGAASPAIRDLSGMTQIDAAEDVLRAAGSPLRVGISSKA